MSASREQAGPQPPKPTRPWTDPLQRTVDRLRVSPVDTDVNSIELDSLSVRSAKASRGSEESDVAMDDARVSAGSGSAESKGAAMPSDSEGVSSNEKSTGEDWIRQLDEDVEANNRTDHDMDREESPYFIPNNASWRGPGWPGRADGFAGPRFSDRKLSDQDRSIIDDLTVENKELRRRLRRYEAPSSRHLNHDRLFEITAYDSLSPDEYLQLHELLQKFAMGKSIAMSGKSESHAQPQKGLYARNDDSSEAMNDSAYTSGGGSGGSKTGSTEAPRRSSDLRHSTLASRNERARMKAVVKKLEEVFTGRASSAPFGHSESPHVQQQPTDGHVRQEDPYSGQTIEKEEGAREAPIISDTDALAQSNGSSESLVPGEVADQRPTHPTDLDPGRGQNSEQNMEYLRHLTALSPNKSTHSGIDMQGRWVFLNLVANMAQLHSMSVSKAFIEKAIKTVSKNLELSRDGQMVRWTGGGSTESSQGEGDTRINEASSEGSREDLSLKQSNPSSGNVSSSIPGSGGRSAPGLSNMGSNSADSSNFHYKPLFARAGTESDASSASWGTDSVKGNVSSDDWGYSGAYTGNGGSSQRKRSRIGPRVYYRNLPFCTDLATTPSIDASLEATSPFTAERYTSQPIGLPLELPERVPPHTRELFSESGKDEDPPAPGSRTISRCSSSLTIYPSSPASAPSTPPSPIPLKASGIGNTMLADNFAIFTKTAYFTGCPPPPSRLLQSTRRDLEPSALPPALFLPDTDSDVDDSTENDGFADDSSSSEGNLAVMDEDSDIVGLGTSIPGSLDASPSDGLSSPEEDISDGMLPAAPGPRPFLGTIRMNVENFDSRLVDYLPTMR